MWSRRAMQFGLVLTVMATCVVMLESPALASAPSGSTIANQAARELGADCHAYDVCDRAWCADFVIYVWLHAGVANLAELTTIVGSFNAYGAHNGTASSVAHVGDAVVFKHDGPGLPHVRIVTAVSGSQIKSIGGNEGGLVKGQDWYSGTVGSRAGGLIITGYVRPASAPAAPTWKSQDRFRRYWVSTFATGPGLIGTSQVGSLWAGENYVFCKVWGGKVGSSTVYNHWWMWTDLDTGGSAWVSAYYLSLWGNDEARDDDGAQIPVCE